jgi:penicillin-binding protein 1A
VFPDGSVDRWTQTPKRVFTDGEAYAATTVLKGVITSGTGTAAGYGCPAAGKTGTAENYANAWFVGYTPKLATAVWVGYPQGNLPMANGFGGTLAAPIWHDFMQRASDGYCGDFPTPTDPFSGTPFFGPHAATGAPTPGTGNGSGTGTTGTTTTTGKTKYPSSLFSGGGKTGTGTGKTSGNGNGNGHSGGGHGGGGGTTGGTGGAGVSGH